MIFSNILDKYFIWGMPQLSGAQHCVLYAPGGMPQLSGAQYWPWYDPRGMPQRSGAQYWPWYDPRGMPQLSGAQHWPWYAPNDVTAHLFCQVAYQYHYITDHICNNIFLGYLYY